MLARIAATSGIRAPYSRAFALPASPHCAHRGVPGLARARPDVAIVTLEGGVWVDRHGVPWVDTFNRDVWDYNIALARESVELGFREIQWDYVRFPDALASYLANAVWPARGGRTKEEGVRDFLLYARDQLADLDVPITADVFGLTLSVAGDMNIGQQ